MKFEQIKKESPEMFLRRIGIEYTTFDEIIVLLRETEATLKAQGGKSNNYQLKIVCL